MDNSVRSLLLDRVKDLARKNIKPEAVEQFVEFSDCALHLYPDPDYYDRPGEDFFWAFHALFNVATQRAVGETSVRVYNPTLERDGWDGSRTFICINRIDIPFLLDSVRLLLIRRNLNIFTNRSNPIWVERDDQGRMLKATSIAADGFEREAVIAIEVDLLSETELEELQAEICDVLDDVALAVSGYPAMRSRLGLLITDLASNVAKNEHLEESLDFLNWMYSNYFVYLGCVEYELVNVDGKNYLREVPGSRLGIFKKYGFSHENDALDLSPEVRNLYSSNEIITFTKSSVRSRIHRSAYSDYVVVKRYDHDKKVVGEIRFMGLYTSQVYTYSPSSIPLIRKKLDWVMEESGFGKDSHDGKALLSILESYPRDDLFYAHCEDIKETAIGIWRIYEQRAIKVFMQPDPFGKFVSCTVYLPRDVFTTTIRHKVQEIFSKKLDAKECEFDTQFLYDSVLVRIHLVFQIKDKKYEQVSCVDLESEIRHLAYDWSHMLSEAAIAHWGESEGLILARQYQNAFASAYQEKYSPGEAVRDILMIQSLQTIDDIAIEFSTLEGSDENLLRLKLFHLKQPLTLSDMVPILENLGLRVLVENPHRIEPRENEGVWMQDFHLTFPLSENVDVCSVRESFADALRVIWKGEAEDDTFNRFVVGAGLDWHRVALLRLYARYLKQLGVSYSQNFIADTLAKHLAVTQQLVALFACYFDPHNKQEQTPKTLRQSILRDVDDIENVNEDNVLRLYLEAIEATSRTNFYQCDGKGNHNPCIAVKLEPRKISQAPKPRPAYEIFVYSPRVEGVHLRGGKVARGGLRWSDRLEDYRTEVLGLVKAQQVKNAVIVPTGAKGGFVAKQANPELGREAWLAEGIASYKMYIQSLLDVTDNLVAGELVPPRDVVRRDGDDPYLVVAADKGTATFSDIANGIAEANNFWLGDAFASGGSNGYDHKGMGITAKGAWVAVQRHFRELGVNIQEEAFTVVGIGDMAGDVFGNGMLLSEHIQLVAAFNHLHIFIDPEPDAAATFKERKRLFDTPRTGWDDFDKTLISKGGGVFSRNAKTLDLTPEIKARFDIKKDQVTPTEFIGSILRSQVDLIWNGGIGTYVKSSAENNADVGDRANDSLRVNGVELRCKVFGEGGNLGMTQRGRIEFCLNGGICNTDFIDNAAGVDCSDHEVNIKILLNEQVMAGDLTLEDRNVLLASMTDSVSELVLHNNYRQTQSISLSMFHSDRKYAEYQRFMNWLEDAGRLDPKLEFLPDEEQLFDRLSRSQPAWTRPELSVLISYAKILLKEELLEADLLSDLTLAKEVFSAFPPALMDKYQAEMSNHRLRQEIVSTQLANDLVDRMGFTFFYRQIESTGACADEVIRAYVIVMNMLDVERFWGWVESRDYQMSATAQLEVQHIVVRMVRRATRWFLRNRRQNLDCSHTIAELSDITARVLNIHPTDEKSERMMLRGVQQARLLEQGVADDMAKILSGTDDMFLSVGIADTAYRYKKPVELVSTLYFLLGERLALDWFMSQIVTLEPADRWQDLAREAYVDDLESQRRQLAAALIKSTDSSDAEAIVNAWQVQQEHLIERWKTMINDLRHSSGGNFAMISVALRELLDLVQASVDSASN